MGNKVKRSFADKGLHYIGGVIKTGYVQWELASTKGLLQGCDARVKIFLLLFFIVIISLKRTIPSEIALGVFVFGLAALSRLNIVEFYKRVVPFGFFFGFLIALPASLNIITRGEVLMPLTNLTGSYDLLGYHIPQQIGITRQGMAAVAMLTFRVTNSVALSLLVISTTQFPELVRALKVLRVPDIFLMVLTLTYKYIFIFSRTIEELYLAKKSRLAGNPGSADGRTWVAGRIAYIFRKTQLRCEEVFKAMVGRGFSDDIRFYGYRRMRLKDWSFTAFILAAGILVIKL